MKKKNKVLFTIIPILSIATFLLIWYLLSLKTKGMLPSPYKTLVRFIEIVKKPTNGVSIFEHALVSFRRVLLAYFLASFVAILIGVIFGYFGIVHDYLGPVFEILRPIPPVAWIPLMVIWFGVGESSKLAIVFIGAFFPVLINTYFGMTHLDPIYPKAATISGANRINMLFDIDLPASFPNILVGMKTALSQAWACVIAAEMIVSQKGLGYLIVRSMETADIATIVIALIIISLLSAILSFIFAKLEKVICPW